MVVRDNVGADDRGFHYLIMNGDRDAPGAARSA
jgi:hypothetical protein